MPTAAATIETWYALPDGRRVVGNDARVLGAFLEAVPEMRFYCIEHVVRVFDAARRVLASHSEAAIAAGIDTPPALPMKLPPQWKTNDPTTAFSLP